MKIIFTILFFGLVFFSQQALAAIAFDTSTENDTAWTTLVTSITWAHTTTTTGSNLALVVTPITSDAGGNIVSGVTYNSIALTKATSTVRYTGNTYSYIYYLLGPATSTNNIVVSFSEIASNANGFSASYTGVSQVAIDAFNSNIGTGATNATVSITTVADNSWLVGGAAFESNISNGADTVIRQENEIDRGLADSNGAKTPPGSFSLNVTQNSGNFGWSAISLAPVGAAAAAATPYMDDYQYFEEE